MLKIIIGLTTLPKYPWEFSSSPAVKGGLLIIMLMILCCFIFEVVFFPLFLAAGELVCISLYEAYVNELCLLGCWTMTHKEQY